MSIYNPQRRFLMSVAVAVGGAVMFLVLRGVTSPWLNVERAKTQLRSPERVEMVTTEVTEDATRFFPDHPWVAKSKKHFRDNGRYLFCEKFQLADDGKSLVVKPVAMLWRSSRQETPVTIVADSAELFSTSKFSFEEGELGQISGGEISGNVQIRGADGLNIRGGMFHLVNSPMRLYSSEQIDFAWQHHSGSARSGVEIHLNGDGDGLNDATDISRLQLLGQVMCRFVVPGKTAHDETQRLNVYAAQGFEYDVAMKTGTFMGRSSRGSSRMSRSKKLNPRDEVWVRRIVPDGAADELTCPELRLTFRSTTDLATGAVDDEALSLEHVQAWGYQVELKSPSQGVHLTGNDFQYFVDRRQIDLRNTNNEVNDRRKYVLFTRGNTTLKVPHVRVLHSVEGQVQRVECNGAGLLTGATQDLNSPSMVSQNQGSQTTSADQAVSPTFGARWGKSLVLQSSPDGTSHFVAMDGGATVAELTRSAKLSAQSIAMRLRGVLPQSVVAPPASSSEKATVAARPVVEPSLTPELLTASGNVIVHSAQGDGVVRDTLTVRFRSDDSAQSSVATVSQSQTVDDQDSSDSDSTKPPTDSFSFAADTADATVSATKADTPSAGMPPYEVWLKGHVEVTRSSATEKGDFTATGNQLQLLSTASQQRSIQLFGDPARVVSDGQNLEGPRIDLDELSQKANVVGSGKIRFMTNKGLDGSTLAKPVPLDIYWSDHMNFQKRSAEFVGTTRVVMSDSQVQDVDLVCTGLTVHFSDDVTLNPTDGGAFEAVVSAAASDESKAAGPIKSLECHNRVEVVIQQYAEGSVVARHEALFADLKADLVTGDFNAVGPGFLESISPDKEGKLQGASPVTVRANAPSQTRDTAFVYLKTEFVGGISGNMNQREATLSHNVIAVMTPARHVDERINLQELPIDELPERAGILQADRLTFGAIWGNKSTTDSFSLVARNNARLESRDISANADIITYDHSKEQFIIRADGDNAVTVNHRAGGTGRFNQFSGNRFEYYRQLNQLKADRIGGLNLTRQLKQ